MSEITVPKNYIQLQDWIWFNLSRQMDLVASVFLAVSYITLILCYGSTKRCQISAIVLKTEQTTQLLCLHPSLFCPVFLFVCLQTWLLPLMVITPDQMCNFSQNRHCCIPAQRHSSCSNWKLHCVQLILTTLTTKSAGPFYNIRFHYAALIVNNQSFILVKPSVWRQVGGHVVEWAWCCCVVFVWLLPSDLLLRTATVMSVSEYVSFLVDVCMNSLNSVFATEC